MIKLVDCVCWGLGLGVGLAGFFPKVEAAVFYEPGESFRTMAMGGAGVSSAHDNEAIFFNPAALANVQKNFFDLASLTVGSTYSFNELQKDANTVYKGGAKYADYLQKPGDVQKLSASLQSTLSQEISDRGLNWAAVGLGTSTQYYQVTPAKDASPQGGHFTSYSDIVKIIGGSIPFGFGGFVIGASVKQDTRNYSQYFYPTNDAVANKSPNKQELTGTATSGDIGFLYRVQGDLRFRAGLSVLNVNGLKFGAADTSSAVGTSIDEKPEVNFGLSIGPTIDKWRMILALDYRDITHVKGKVFNGNGVKDDSNVKRTHLGMELGYFIADKTYPLFSLRTGLNQGLLTYGVEMNFLLGRTIVAGYTAYQEDISDPGQSKKVVQSNIYYVSVGLNSL